MTTKSPGQPPTGVDLDLKDREPASRLDFLAAVRPSREANATALKPIVYLHGEPRIVWEEEEVKRMIVKENLEYAVIGKFSYGWTEIQDLRKLIPKQCELKGECNIGLLSNRHILIRASCLEDYVNLLSKPAFYILHRGWTYPMRTLKWEPMFDSEEETSTAMAWISFPSLPPNFFVKEAVFSLAAAVGKPLQVDLATRNQTRPSCARVKVEVDLLCEFPKRINVGMRKQSREITEKWITIRYDHVPKYCKNCKIQGHDEEQCYVLHPDLYTKEKVGKEEEMETGEEKREIQGKRRVQREGNILGKESEEFRIHTNKRGAGGGRQGGGKPEQIWHKKNIQHEKEGITTGNKFGALKDQDECGETQSGQKEKGEKVETKKWVEEVFQKTSRIDKGNSLKSTVENINSVDEEETAGSEIFKNSGNIEEETAGSEIFKNSGNIEVSRKQKCSEQDARSSNMGNTCLEMVEFHEVQDNDEVLLENQRRENRI